MERKLPRGKVGIQSLVIKALRSDISRDTEVKGDKG